MTRKKIPFDFVLDYLFSLNFTVKQMFGMFAIYVDKKIMLILRKRSDHPETNGVWVATSSEHHKSLKKEIPSLRSISIYSKGLRETEWQVIPEDAEAFESHVMKVCELIKNGDRRIGRIPKLLREKTIIRNTL